MKSPKIKFIPGFPERPSSYKALSKYLDIIDIDWNKPRLNFKKIKVLVAFSFGGILALEYALRKRVELLILCSLTPSIETLEKVKTDKVIFIVGGKEKWCLKNIKRVSKTLKGKREIVIIPKGSHKIVRNYRKKLLEIIKNLK